MQGGAGQKREERLLVYACMGHSANPGCGKMQCLHSNVLCGEAPLVWQLEPRRLPASLRPKHGGQQCGQHIGGQVHAGQLAGMGQGEQDSLHPLLVLLHAEWERGGSGCRGRARACDDATSGSQLSRATYPKPCT